MAQQGNIAAEQGDAKGQTNLTMMYSEGRGVPQDDVAAHLWWSLSAAGGSRDALAVREALAKRKSHEQMLEAQKLADERKPSDDPACGERPSCRVLR